MRCGPYKRGVGGYTFYRHVFLMEIILRNGGQNIIQIESLETETG